jgi:hypothetical protein
VGDVQRPVLPVLGRERVRGHGLGLGCPVRRARPAQADHAFVGRLAREQRPDCGAAAAAGDAGAARPPDILGGASAAIDAFADGPITDLIAVADEQSDLLDLIVLKVILSFNRDFSRTIN